MQWTSLEVSLLTVYLGAVDNRFRLDLVTDRAGGGMNTLEIRLSEELLFKLCSESPGLTLRYPNDGFLYRYRRTDHLIDDIAAFLTPLLTYIVKSRGRR